jgi:hypothetical protein
VDEATVQVLLKLGMYGIKVRIMRPARMPDFVEIRESAALPTSGVEARGV